MAQNMNILIQSQENLSVNVRQYKDNWNLIDAQMSDSLSYYMCTYTVCIFYLSAKYRSAKLKVN